MAEEAARDAPLTIRSPTTPYGPLIETRARVVTWNLWWRLGEWRARAPVIAGTLADLRPDLVCLQEVWQAGGRNQAALLAEGLRMHHAFAVDRTSEGADQGVALLSRWPLQDVQAHPLPVPPGVEPNVALRAVVDGPRGPFLAVTTHLIPYPTRSESREQQVRAIVDAVAAQRGELPFAVIGGDFNAVPDADEIRLLTGRRPPHRPGAVFLDAWATAGDESPGHTVSRANPNAAPLLLPSVRWDYLFVTWPSGPGGRGHPVRAEVVGTEARDGVVASDHYAVLAELRY